MNTIDVKQFEEYINYDEPIPYKKLTINPVKVKDYFKFNFAVNCLVIEKNRIPDVKILKMSYLDFLFHLASEKEENQVYLYMLQEIFRICLDVQPEDFYTKKDENGKRSLLIDNEIYDRYDFDNIKNIICYQNNIELPNEKDDPKYLKAIREMREYKRKGHKTCTFERQMVWVMKYLSLSLEDVKELSVRKFFMALENMDKEIHYEILMTAKMGGMVEFKETIDHWMDEPRVDDGLIDYDAFKGNFIGK